MANYFLNLPNHTFSSNPTSKWCSVSYQTFWAEQPTTIKFVFAKIYRNSHSLAIADSFFSYFLCNKYTLSKQTLLTFINNPDFQLYPKYLGGIHCLSLRFG